MDLEEQILRYYLSLFSIFTVLFIYIFYLLNFKSINLDEEIFIINKGDTINKISNKIIKNNNIVEKKVFKIIFYITDKYYSPINYGKFKIRKKTSIKNILKIISKKSNLDHYITIINGWEQYQLSNYLKNFYSEINDIPYNDLLADTYLINSSNSFIDLTNFLNKNKNDFFNKYNDNFLLKKYGIDNFL